MTIVSATSSQDLVAILDNDSFRQIFLPASPIRISVRESKKATRFSVEDGSTRSDHVVTDAIEISFEIFLSSDQARNGYEQIRQAWRDNVLVIVQTQTSSYPNMLIEEIPHDERIDLGGALIMPIRMIEWRTYEPQYGALPMSKVKSPKQSSTVKGGQKQTTETDPTTSRRGSVLYGVFN